MASSSSSSAEEREDFTRMVDESVFLTGRLDPASEKDYVKVEALDLKKLEQFGADFLLEKGKGKAIASSKPSQSSEVSNPDVPIPQKPLKAILNSLPSEIIDQVVSFLSPFDLITLNKTCRYLASHSRNDLHWQRHVQHNVPGVTVTTPWPCATYRELYIAHDPHWFLPKYKIWFCDYFLTGKLIIARYDPRRGCIEGYRLVAERSPVSFATWEADEEVLIHSFDPKVRLHMDQPVLQLNALSLENLMSQTRSVEQGYRYTAELPMPITERNNNGIFSSFELARPVEERPGMELWPPKLIPADHRIRNNIAENGFTGYGHKPQKRAEVSDKAFRIRRWMEMVRGQQAPGVHVGEEVYTYATLNPKWYTPTREKPWRGIWVGDYSGHGCEFLLMHQPDNEEPFDEASVVQREDETPEEFEKRKEDERVYRGSLLAIKLTGDPNVPRGESSFVADDLSDAAYVRTADEARFKGARIVQSRGHIAARMFRNDKYIESQLIMISPNKLAQYWVEFGHISFYERVNIDAFLSPANDPVPGQAVCQ